MANTRECRACGKAFKPDNRNQGRQSYCRRPGCQRLRRTLRQRLRRQTATSKPRRSTPATTARGLQADSHISEADIRLEYPVIIGLISMFTGLTNLEDIEQVYRQCYRRGLEILPAGKHGIVGSPAIISPLDKSKDQSCRNG